MVMGSVCLLSDGGLRSCAFFRILSANAPSLPPSPRVGMRSLRAVLCWLAALPGLAALQVSRPLLPAASARLAARRYPGIALALSDEHGMQVRIDSCEEEEEAEVTAEDTCMLLVHMQPPADTGALFWSEVLMESGAWCVSLSDGAFGTEEEEPIYSVHAPGSVAPELETWGQLLEARHLWSNTSIEVGFPVGTDVEATLLLAAASAGLDAPPRFRIENLVRVRVRVRARARFRATVRVRVRCRCRARVRVRARARARVY